jgi:hypothetical protein
LLKENPHHSSSAQVLSPKCQRVVLYDILTFMHDYLAVAAIMFLLDFDLTTLTVCFRKIWECEMQVPLLFVVLGSFLQRMIHADWVLLMWALLSNCIWRGTLVGIEKSYFSKHLKNNHICPCPIIFCSFGKIL